MRRTKIIATLGPASATPALLDGVVAAGADLVRLNFSHGTHESQTEMFHRVRAAAGRCGREVAILQDLGGPKIRTGALEGGRPLQVQAGEPLTIGTGRFVGGPGRLSTAFAGLAPSVRPGDRLLLADGLVELRVEATDGTEIRTTVVEGGAIGEHKGINAPGVRLPASAVTPKDVDDLRLGLALGVDMVALSFVQSAADLSRIRQVIVAAGGGDMPVVAKLERPEALEDLDGILAASQGVMVARGDLGLEMPLERVPTAQKTITRKARERGIPVIVATQVLESMTTEPRPTRAEVNDAANAVADGVDAIMLAGETAVGAFPVRTVATLDAIIREAEASLPGGAVLRVSGEGHDPAWALCEAAVTLAGHAEAQAIVAVTAAGDTARRLAALRPRAPIIAASGRRQTVRHLALCWGVQPVHVPIGEDAESVGALVGQELLAGGVVSPGDTVVLVRISPDLTRADANYLKLHRL
jgi:pyruvate kinase